MSTFIAGPSGGLGGYDFGEYLVPDGARLKEVHVFASDYIDAIQFVYRDHEGNPTHMARIGGWGGTHNVFVLDDDEYITGMSGYYGWYIDLLRIHTNRRTSPDYGQGGGEYEFRLNVPNTYEVVGLLGRCDWFIDSISLIGRERLSTPAAAPLRDTPEPAPAPPSTAATTQMPPEPPADPVSAAAAERQPKPKELQKIEGIGPKLASILNDNGILDLHDLAHTTLDHLREILKPAGTRYANAASESWIEQAALGAKGDWDGLAALQKQLKGR